MPAISNASPIIVLAKLGRLRLLKELYGELIITPFVKIETVDRGKELGATDALEIENAIKELFAKGYNLSVNANYPTEENIKVLLNKAYQNEKAIAVNANYPTKEFINDLVIKAILQANALKSLEGGN